MAPSITDADKASHFTYGAVVATTAHGGTGIAFDGLIQLAVEIAR